MILGDYCTRSCLFCGIFSDSPEPVEPDEPERVAEAVKRLNLDYVVITSVTRDDLSDGGANHFAQTIGKILEFSPKTLVEVLTPDFRGDLASLGLVVGAGIRVFGHNLETVPRLYSKIRPQARYETSLSLLSKAKELYPQIYTKSSLMVGLGETSREVERTLKDLRSAGCDIVTIGQYLPPSPFHYPLQRFVHPRLFLSYETIAQSLGFISVSSGPFVRSSYRAEEALLTTSKEDQFMNINVTARHFELTPPIKEYTEGALLKLQKYFNRISETHVILERVKYRNSAEVSLRLSNGITFVAKEESPDMYLSIDQAAQKLESQIKSYKDRLKKRKQTKEGERWKE